MNISRPFLQRPVMTTLVMLAILLLGALAFWKLPVSDVPEFHHPVIVIQTNFSGASVEMVYQEVTEVLEKELTQVKGIREMSSQTAPGYSSITLKFPIEKNMHEAENEVQRALHQITASLPKELDSPPRLIVREESQSPIMCLKLSSDVTPKDALRHLADTLIIPQLNRIEGVANVTTFGPARSCWIRLDPERMQAFKIGFNEVVTAIQNKTEERSLGSIQKDNKKLNISLSGALKKSQELEELPIGPHRIKLKEIGEVSEEDFGTKECHFVTPTHISPMVFMMVQKTHEGNTVSISYEIKRAISSIQKELPTTATLDIWFDKATWISESVHDVGWSFFLACALVFIVLYMSLGRIWEACIPSAAIPLSLIGSFAFMYLLNFNLDLLSSLALTLSVGFVVDDAIVVVENIVRMRDQGLSSKEASLKGSQEIGFTVLSMTLSLVAVFIPILFMPGIYGVLFREFSITLACAILISGVISLTLTPLLCSRSRSIASHKESSQLLVLYEKSLKACFRYPKTICTIALSLLCITIPLFMRLPVTLIPPEDRGILFAACVFPTSLSQELANSYQKEAELLIQQNRACESVCSAQFTHGLFFFIKLLPRSERPPQQQVVSELKSALDTIIGATTYIHMYQLINLDFDAFKPGDYKLLVKGQQFEDVQLGAKELYKALSNSPLIAFVHNSSSSESRELVVEVNEDQAKALGFTKKEIQELLHYAYGAHRIGSLHQDAKRVDIHVELKPEYAKTAATLNKLFLTNEEGVHVPFKTVASWKEASSAASYELHDRLPVATLSFSFVPNVSVDSGLREVELLAEKVLPNTLTSRFDGTALEIANSAKNTLYLLLAACIVMYIVLGILYESFLHPLIILSSIPFAGLGGVLTLSLFHESLNIFSAVGFLLLIGIVKKNGIMLVDYAIQAERCGHTPFDAIFEASLVRFRPIMMTTFAALMGALPLALGFQDMANMRQGLGLVIVGGLLFSQLLTLYITPLLYLLLSKQPSPALSSHLI